MGMNNDYLKDLLPDGFYSINQSFCADKIIEVNIKIPGSVVFEVENECLNLAHKMAQANIYSIVEFYHHHYFFYEPYFAFSPDKGLFTLKLQMKKKEEK